mgnify:CR=1 FL=1
MDKLRTSLRLLVKVGINLSSIILGGFMLIVFGCIIYAVVQQMWPSVFILISMEAILVLITACAGAVDFFLQEACVGIGNFMRS